MNDALRARVITEALEWIGTPYVDHARVKGRNGGADCLTFIAGVYESAGVIDRLAIPHYAHDWHLHSDDEHYLNGKDGGPGMLHFCEEIEGPPLPADIAMWKFGLSFSHSSIVIKWPLIIHTVRNRGVGRDDAERRTILRMIHENIPERGQPRPRKFFRVKGWT